MSSYLSRRQFLNATAGLPLAAGLGTFITNAAETKPAIREFRRGGMLYRRLGQTDIFVSVLGFGSHTDAAFKQAAKRGNVPYHVLSAEGQAQRDRQIARAFDLGVNILDVYEDEGQLEPAARVVRSRRDKVLVSHCPDEAVAKIVPRAQFPVFVGQRIDQAAKLFGHVDLFRLVLDKEKGAELSGDVLESWDMLRKAKEVGKIRATGIAAHSEITMRAALEQLEGLDYVFFPYNFIHARAEYSGFLEQAIHKGVGLIAIKPLAGGSIVQLDARARPSTPEKNRIQLFQSRYRPLLPAAIAELTKSLNQLPDETLCQAALRFVYSRPFISCSMTGTFQDQDLQDNYAALTRQLSLSHEEIAVLGDIGRMTKGFGPDWVLPQYRWLEEQWRA